ncbi:MAG: tRNA-dihydrouridine synthase family protein [Muribaculaceae bacterium]|nr:tRNA-dihydrouridine synthase family protein [Muribaculaceae bacterium]
MKSVSFAPVQGHTDAAYRHFHEKVYGTGVVFYTPFIRLEKGDIRQKDHKDITSYLNTNHNLVPQIIFKDEKELNSLVEKLKKENVKEIDLNMGCPFPLQTGHGRGASTIIKQELAENILKIIEENPSILFSVKMRLGLNSPEEWKVLLPFLNRVKLKHITLHPRIAKQQYAGEVDLIQFRNFLANSVNPVIYNGDLKTPEDINKITRLFPEIKGFMTGRGTLGRPSLISEYMEGNEWDKSKRIDKMLYFHKLLFDHYSNILCGDSQIISKIQPFWEYAEDEIGRKSWKAIKKATNISKYQTAVASI